MTNEQPAPTTTDAGIPVASDDHSLTVGPDGPILLHDHYLIEKMAQFNRERVPERQPHAKGGGAFGRFEVTNDLRDHDMQWDFWTLSPESAHQVTWLMGDRGIPRTWRHMNGYSSHAYMWINAADERFWVQYHFKTDQGIEFFTQAEADKMAGVDG